MDIRLDDIDRAETLRYLNYSGGNLDALVTAQLEAAEDKIIGLAQPRFVYRLFDLEWQEGSLRLRDTALALLGEEIRIHLDYCGPCSGAADFEAELRRVIASRCRDRVPDSLIRRVAEAIDEEGRQHDTGH